MSVTVRRYRPEDFTLVSDFLVTHYKPGNQDGNWLQASWEYMHSHPNLDETALGRIGVWEHVGELVGIAHYENSLGDVFFQYHPEYRKLKPAMLAYAEEHLCGKTSDGKRFLNVYVNDFDRELESLVKSQGFEIDERFTRPTSWLAMPPSFPVIDLPAGFRVKSLADENNLRKIHRVLWRGFNHPGEPPEEGIEWRRKMQSGPNFRKDLTIVIEDPLGDFVSFCGMWFDPVNQIACVEPMATDPDYRRRDLGKAALWEGIRRCANLGAEEVFVGSDQDFYRRIGFEKLYDTHCWVKGF